MAAKNSYHNDENSALISSAAVIALVAVLFAVIWHNFHAYISWFAIQCAWTSLPLLESAHSFVSSSGVPSIVVNFLFPQEIIDDLASLKYWLPRTDPQQVNFQKFGKYMEIFGYSARIISPFVAAITITYVWRRSKAARLSRVMNIFTRAKLSMIEFPQIRPAIVENLLKQNPDQGYFRREASPIRYAILNGLVTAYTVDFKGTLLPEIVTPTFEKKMDKTKGYEYIQDNLSNGIAKLHNRCILDRDKTEKRFIKQLGESWSGSDNLTPLVKGLYAALIAFASSDKDTSFALLDQFNRSWIPPRKKNTVASIDITGIDKIIEKYENTDHIQEILGAHSYVTTVMARLLEAARGKGRLGTSLFLWLKVADRVLWYTLNQEGGQCGWTEAAGPRAHKIAETAALGPLYQPFVKNAVTEFEYYLQVKEGWLPLPEMAPKPVGT